MARLDKEDELLKSVAFQNATSILLARQRAEDELLRTREALRQNQERLTAALNAAGTGTFRWDFGTDTVEWDGNLDRLFGLTSGQTTQSLDVFVAAVHPDDRPAVLAGFRNSMREGTDFDMVFRVVWPDGGIRWIADAAKTFFDGQGRPLYMTGACADITSRRVAAEALRENEERLRAMFNHAAVGIAVAALDGRFVDMNRKFSDILGYSAEQLRQRTFAELTHPDDRAVTAAAIRQLIAGVIEEYSLEKRYLRHDGSVVWILATVTLLRDAAGKPQQFLGVIEDITRRKRAEAALREETRVLELLNQTGRMLASTLDLPALIQAVTDASTELSGAQFGAYFSSTNGAAGGAFVLDALSGVSRELFEEQVEPVALVALVALSSAATLSRCDNLRQSAGAGPVISDHGTASANLPLRSYLAVAILSRSTELIGGLFFGHSQPQMFSERSERLITGVVAQAGIAIDNARLYEVAQRAAEERQSLLESERAARTAAERMSDVKDEFLATLSHELRTPLNAILGWSQVLRSGARNQSDLAKELETIERNARAQTQLIEDLLDMSRITSGKLRLDIQPVQPVSFIEAALETVTPAAAAKSIRLERLFDPSAGPISGDPGRLQQVIWNLVANAIKFTPRNGRVQVLLERVNSHIEISVADTGVGIRPEFIPHLFERFRQGDASTTRKFGGLGLGLSIVKSLVELHGGTASVKSGGEGLGTTVTIHLPLTAVYRPADRSGRLDPAFPQVNTASFVVAELTGLKVLVVDDQSDARDLIRRVLEECAADVSTAGSAEEAMRLVQALRPDVLISDIGMPDVDGFELIRRVRSLGADRGGTVPAIALTAFSRSEDRTRALRAGFLVHLSKPVDPSELVATVASVAGRVDQRP